MRPRQGGHSSIAGLTSVYYMIKVTLAVVLAYLRNAKRFLAIPPARGTVRLGSESEARGARR